MPGKDDAYADQTLDAYSRHAGAASAEWARLRVSRFHRRFARLLPSGGRVLDYGCGTGQDMAWLLRSGFSVDGIDGTQEFVEEAKRRCPSASIRVERFESVTLPQDHYDGVWCQAALIHVPPDVLVGQLAKLRMSLKPRGVLGLSLPWGRAKKIFDQGWLPGRYVASYTKAEAMETLRGWALEDLRVATHDGRRGRWVQLLARPGLGG